MTPSPTQFCTYSPCPSNKKISTVEGTLITTAGQGYVQINLSITLQNGLRIPKLLTSLTCSCPIKFPTYTALLSETPPSDSSESDQPVPEMLPSTGISRTVTFVSAAVSPASA